MYTEIIKIIEGGLIGDREKVRSYAAVLADNLERNGEDAFSKKIKRALSSKKGKLTSLDSFSTKPLDTESRMDIVDVSYPQVPHNQIVLSKSADEEINSFIEGYKRRDDLLKAGLVLSNSLLLYGPPGCGKTTVAQYISSVTGLPLVTGRLDALVSSLLGSTAKNIRKTFDYASKRECILFLDEFDVIAKLRDDKNELGELKRVVNSLIQNIDGLDGDSILIAATNHHELLDSAIWRRFSKVIALEKPQHADIQRLLHIYLEGTSNEISGNDKKIEQLTKALVGLSHSDIKTVISNALRDSIIQERNILTSCDVLRNIYLHRNHNIESESDYILFLLHNNATHKEIYEILGIPLRKIQTASKQKPKEG